MPHLLVSITSHGFGHAAQTAPVINALRRLAPDLRLTLRTDLPRWFLASRFTGKFDVISGAGDFGLIMDSALAVARVRSAARYAQFHAEWVRHVDAEADALRRLRPDAVLSNVSYLTLAAARAVGITPIALCSFTWAQIYAHYFSDQPEADRVLAQMHGGYDSAALTLALAPGMPLQDLPGYAAVGVVARRGSLSGAQLRVRLGLDANTRIIALSLGGVDPGLDLSCWPRERDFHWIVPKAVCPLRPDMSAQEDLPIAFSDLLAGTDAFVTKPGYGNFTEAACCGVPVLYVAREDWPEEPYLLAWMSRHARLKQIDRSALVTGAIRPAIEELWRSPRPAVSVPDGTPTAAELLAQALPGVDLDPSSPANLARH